MREQYDVNHPALPVRAVRGEVQPARRAGALNARDDLRVAAAHYADIEAAQLKARTRIIVAAILAAAVVAVAAAVTVVLVTRSHDQAHQAIEQAKYANASWREGFAAKSMANDAMRTLLTFGAVAAVIVYAKSKISGGTK